jgi:DNA-directed RNA polymerase subunit M/transcription elongation factor TFIIS
MTCAINAMRFCNVCKNKWTFTTSSEGIEVVCKVCGNVRKIEPSKNDLFTASKNTLADLYSGVIS